MTDESDKKEQAINKSDSDLWKAMTKDVRPLPGKNYVEPAQEGKPKATSFIKETILPSENVDLPSRVKGKDIDGRTNERLRRGKIDIEGTIDLHGYTQDEAFESLERFIQSAHSRGKRCVLVITGKGSLSNPGVLRQKVPGWLSAGALGNIVLKTHSAQPKHGGSGALYVYLRKTR